MKQPCRKHYFRGESFALCPDCGFSGEFTPTKFEEKAIESTKPMGEIYDSRKEEDRCDRLA